MRARSFALLIVACLASTARAEYAPHMEPGRLAVRHASWSAAETCREHSVGESIEMSITLGRRGRVLSVATDPVAPAFARCVRGELARERFSVTGSDAAGPRWVVTSRYVFPPR